MCRRCNVLEPSHGLEAGTAQEFDVAGAFHGPETVVFRAVELDELLEPRTGQGLLEVLGALLQNSALKRDVPLPHQP